MLVITSCYIIRRLQFLILTKRPTGQDTPSYSASFLFLYIFNIHYNPQQDYNRYIKNIIQTNSKSKPLTLKERSRLFSYPKTAKKLPQGFVSSHISILILFILTDQKTPRIVIITIPLGLFIFYNNVNLPKIKTKKRNDFK